MDTNFKIIHIGSLIKQRIIEKEVEISRMSHFMKCEIKDLEDMLLKDSLNTDVLLKWSKLLEYDFFRIYSQHLILYSPPTKISFNKETELNSLPKFKKNIYTMEMIEYILEIINSNEKTKDQIIQQYRIPKTTLYKWITKYKK